MAKKNSSVSNISLSPYDAIFGDDVNETVNQGDRIIELEIADLYPFKNHPFQIPNNVKMEETLYSIEKYGVITPIIVRTRSEGGYEIISGHCRTEASKQLKIKTIPAIIKELNDEESTIFMVDSNLQREQLLPSEKAFAYKMKIDAIKCQGERTDLASAQLGQRCNKGKTSVEMVAEQSQDSRNQIKRYIRLTELIPELRDMVDRKKLAFNTGVELSYLSDTNQKLLHNKILDIGKTPTMSQATKLKKYEQDNKLGHPEIQKIFQVAGGPEIQVVLKSEQLKPYFGVEYDSNEIEGVIIQLLEDWCTKGNGEIQV